MMKQKIIGLALVLSLVAGVGLRAEPQTFDSNGVEISYEVWGEGEPVVLIHGFTANTQTQWGGAGIIRKLAETHQVIAYDNRGHGKSGKPHGAEHYGMEMVNDPIRLLDHLNIEKAHFVGYSLGGFITSKVSDTYPDRVITATLGGAGWSKEGDGSLDMLTELADSLEQGRGFGPLIRGLTPADAPRPTEESLAGMNQILTAMNDTEALAGVIRGMTELRIGEADIKANGVPTLALIGSRDPLKAGVDLMDGVKPHLTVSVIEGADHMTAFGAPKFIGDLQAFLTAHANGHGGHGGHGVAAHGQAGHGHEGDGHAPHAHADN